MSKKNKKVLKKITRWIIRSTPISWLISCIAYIYIIFICRTTKWHIEGYDKIEKIWNENKNAIVISWHGRMALLPYFWNRKHPINALVSLHHDGRLIANLIHLFNAKTIDGSTSENAKSSALNIVRVLKDNQSVCITPDGPRGPRQRMTISPLYFSQKTGTPIIPVSYSIQDSKIIEKSWDKMILPKPFNKGTLIVGDPIIIPNDATDKELETYRLKIESILNDIMYKADRFVGLPKITPEDTKKEKKRKK